MTSDADPWRVPRDESDRLQLLAERPLGWEYLLFAGALLRELARVEPKWRDFHLGYSMATGQRLETEDLPAAASDRMSRVVQIIANMDRVISERAQELSFGAPGEAGDPGLIEHTANRLAQLYEQLLDWTDEVRSLRLPEDARALPDLMVQMVTQAIGALREFVGKFVVDLEYLLREKANDPSYPGQIDIVIKIFIPHGVSESVVSEITRIVRD